MGKTLSYGGLVKKSRSHFEQIPEHRQAGKISISLPDAIMSGLGIFALKFPSLLKFDNDIRVCPDGHEAKNFRSLFGVENIPDDTNMRRILDGVDPAELRPLFKENISELRIGKKFEPFMFYRGNYLLALDGTGFFSSKEINCSNCCVKNHRDGTQTFYHQMLGGAFIHPDFKEVVPLAPEAILKQDGATKNDCELNSSKRFLSRFRQDFPRLGVIVVEDSLSSNFPHISLLKQHQMHFILGIKPGNHAGFFERLSEDQLAGKVKTFEVVERGVTHRFEYINIFRLLENEETSEVNFFRYVEINSKGKEKTFSWVTDFEISRGNIMKLMRGGRARWKIENEVFNTLKNQGYQFEHNFGHGHNNLSTNFAILMVLAFMIDQISELGCKLYQAARKRVRTKYSLWERMRSAFNMVYIPDWDTMFKIVSGAIKLKTTYDTS